MQPRVTVDGAEAVHTSTHRWRRAGLVWVRHCYVTPDGRRVELESTRGQIHDELCEMARWGGTL